jgi:hypothetical protein
MRTTLKDATLLLVKRHAETRGALEKLAEETKIPYFTLWRLASGGTKKIDAGVCQHLYEHLTGNALDIR